MGFLLLSGSSHGYPVRFRGQTSRCFCRRLMQPICKLVGGLHLAAWCRADIAPCAHVLASPRGQPARAFGVRAEVKNKSKGFVQYRFAWRVALCMLQVASRNRRQARRSKRSPSRPTCVGRRGGSGVYGINDKQHGSQNAYLLGGCSFF